MCEQWELGRSLIPVRRIWLVVYIVTTALLSSWSWNVSSKLNHLQLTQITLYCLVLFTHAATCMYPDTYAYILHTVLSLFSVSIFSSFLSPYPPFTLPFLPISSLSCTQELEMPSWILYIHTRAQLRTFSGNISTVMLFLSPFSLAWLMQLVKFNKNTKM